MRSVIGASSKLYRNVSIATLLAPILFGVPARADERALPNVLVVTVDTLRSDHMSAYGYSRPTTPNIDRLIAAGVRFDAARTVEPLTGPALVSMLTSQYPHQHGATRNGLRMRTGIASLPKALQGRGYLTAAYVGNWTLRDKLCGLAEHFELYEEVLTRRRWWGLIRREADGEDLTDAAVAWVRGWQRSGTDAPFLLWVHYVEPHAPYRAHDEFREPLGLPTRGDLTPAERYDTEIAFVDSSIGRLLREVDGLVPADRTIILFASDHGESLGEHGYWGHGRNLYEPTLRIPMSVTWPGRLEPEQVDSPALLIDLAPTVLGLLDVKPPAGLEGFDWSKVIAGQQPAPSDRETRYQAHRGAVLSKHESEVARRSGLLEVGILRHDTKEIFHVGKERRELYDLAADPAELTNRSAGESQPSEAAIAWMREVQEGLARADGTPTPEPIDEESAAMLRVLGYVD